MKIKSFSEMLYFRCMVPTPRRGLGLRKVNVGTSYINNVAPPALLCNTVIDYMNCTTVMNVIEFRILQNK